MDCSVDDCTRAVQCRGYCSTHYARLRRTGSLQLLYERHAISDISDDVGTCSICGPSTPLIRSSRGPLICQLARKKQKSRTRLVGQTRRDPALAERERERRYGINVSTVLASQDFACAICRDPLTVTDTHVDHDHSCCPNARSCGSCVRGLLCRGCNSGLGMFRDDANRLAAAIKYLHPSA